MQSDVTNDAADCVVKTEKAFFLLHCTKSHGLREFLISQAKQVLFLVPGKMMIEPGIVKHAVSIQE